MSDYSWRFGAYRPTVDDLRRAYHNPRRVQIDTTGIRAGKLGRIGPVRVWLVRGLELRNTVDPDWVAGGNEARYGYNPTNEIWIDEVLVEGDRAPVILHEIYELCWMLRGDSYDDAHEKATALERRLRSTWPDWEGQDPLDVVRAVLNAVQVRKAG